MDEDEDVARELEELEKLPYDLYLDDVDQSVVDWASRGQKTGGPNPRRVRRGVRSNRGGRFIDSESDMFDVESGVDSKWQMESIKESGGGDEYGYGQSSRGGHRGPPGFKPFGRLEENVKEQRGGEEYGYGTSRGDHRGPPGFKPFGRAGDEDAGYGRGSYERSWSTEEDAAGGTAGLPTFAPHRKDPRLAGNQGFCHRRWCFESVT